MKSFKQWLLEKTLEQTIKEHGKTFDDNFIKNVYSKLENVGDIRGKYISPILKLLKIEGKNENNIEKLETLVQKIIKNNIKGIDLNSFKSIEDLENKINSNISEKGVDKSDIILAYNPNDENDPDHKKIINIPKNGDNNFELVENKGNFRIYKIGSLEAAQKYTPMKYLGWCTAGNIHYKNYSNKGDKLFVILKGNEFFGQLFFPAETSNQSIEFNKPSANSTCNGPAPQDPIDIDEFYEDNSELQDFLNKNGYIKFNGFKFKGIKLKYTKVKENGEDIVYFDSVSLIDMNLNSLNEFKEKLYELEYSL